MTITNFYDTFCFYLLIEDIIIMKWLKQLFSSTGDIEYLKKQINSFLAVCELLERQNTNLSERIKHLENILYRRL